MKDEEKTGRDAQPTKGFWSTAPGVLTGLAALVTAVAGAVALLRSPAPGTSSSSTGPGGSPIQVTQVVTQVVHVESPGTVRTASTPRETPDPPSVTLPERRSDCVACRTQEDFDAAWDNGAKQSRCCPVTACEGDSDCPGARVCCRIPMGRLCTDARRCTSADRVQQ